ncbi:MAG: hypothetical protein ACE5NA_07525 [Nitrospiraceae bacterium]
MRPRLHVQNIFDALNPNGMGVSGDLKLRCLHLQKRVFALAKPGDVVAVSADCSPAFVEYMTRTTSVSDVIPLRHQVSADPQRNLNSQSVFEALAHSAHWEAARQRHPVLSPYIKSAEIYRVSETAGIAVSDSENQATKDVEFSDKMNDKAVFYEECEEMGIPVPRHWVFNGRALADQVLQLLAVGHGPLILRQTRSGGTAGNITADRTVSKYRVPELRAGVLSDKEFVKVLQEFGRSSFSDQFVVTEFLDLYASPGTLFYSDEAGVTVISHTYQILDKNRVFLGFSFPIEDERICGHFPSIEEWVHRLMEPWWQRGYRGYGNIDWMVTKDGESFLAERNARQTGVIPPLAIANALLGHDRASPCVVAPETSIVTRDSLHVRKAMTFEQVYGELEKRKLLWEQSDHGEGVIVSIPPSPEFGIHSIGILAIGASGSTAHEIHDQALHALGTAKSELLFAAER